MTARRRLLCVRLAGALAACGLLALPAAGASVQAGDAATAVSATLQVALDGFSYLDGSRDSVLTATGWCPSGERLVTLGCQVDPVGGSARLHTGLLGFDAARRVSPAAPSPAGATLSRRVLLVEVFPDRPGHLEVTVDAAPAGGATFTVVTAAALPAPDQADAARVTWTADSTGTGEHAFTVAYDTALGTSGADDAIPAVTVRLDHGDGQVAAEHLRGSVPAPSGAPIHRVSELAYSPRVVAPTGPPRLDGGQFNPSVGPVRTGIRLSNTHQITALGDAPPQTFADDWVYAEYAETGRYVLGSSLAWIRGQTSDSIAAGIDYEYEKPLQPPFFRIFSGLGFIGDTGRGLLDGEAVRATFQARVKTSVSHAPEGEPRNDDGQLVFDWDGQIFDEVGFIDAYGHLAPGNVRVQEQGAHTWLQSMWTVESRMTGGDIDRRTDDPVILDPPVVGVYVEEDREPDASFHLDVPEGWHFVRVIILGGSQPSRGSTGGVFHEDGSYTHNESVDPGEYWLESETGPDGMPTWSWPMTLITEAWPDDGGNTIRPPVRIDTHYVADGDELVVQSFTLGGDPQRLVLGPGTHQVRTNPDGTMQLID